MRTEHRPSYEETIEKLVRRVEALERNQRVPGSSIRDGAYTVLDSSGDPVVVLGKLEDDSYGIRVIAPNGTTDTLNVDQNGWSKPNQYVPIFNTLSSASALVGPVLIDQTTYDLNNLFNGGYQLPQGGSNPSGPHKIPSGTLTVKVYMQQANPPSNLDFELRLRDPSNFSSVISLDTESLSGVNGADFDLVGDVSPYVGDGTLIEVLAKRSSGATPAYYHCPFAFYS